jgi:hypothetical protein
MLYPGYIMRNCGAITKLYIIKVIVIAKVTAPLKWGQKAVEPLIPLFLISGIPLIIRKRKNKKHSALLWNV